MECGILPEPQRGALRDQRKVRYGGVQINPAWRIADALDGLLRELAVQTLGGGGELQGVHLSKLSCAHWQRAHASLRASIITGLSVTAPKLRSTPISVASAAGGFCRLASSTHSACSGAS